MAYLLTNGRAIVTPVPVGGGDCRLDWGDRDGHVTPIRRQITARDNSRADPCNGPGAGNDTKCFAPRSSISCASCDGGRGERGINGVWRIFPLGMAARTVAALTQLSSPIPLFHPSNPPIGSAAVAGAAFFSCFHPKPMTFNFTSPRQAFGTWAWDGQGIVRRRIQGPVGISFVCLSDMPSRGRWGGNYVCT